MPVSLFRVGPPRGDCSVQLSDDAFEKYGGDLELGGPIDGASTRSFATPPRYSPGWAGVLQDNSATSAAVSGSLSGATSKAYGFTSLNGPWHGASASRLSAFEATERAGAARRVFFGFGLQRICCLLTMRLLMS